VRTPLQKIKYSPHVTQGVGELVFFLVRPRKAAKDVNLISVASLQAIIPEWGQENLSLVCSDHSSSHS